MRLLLVLTFFWLGLTSPAEAHAVGMEVKIQGDAILVEVFFDLGEPAAQAKIRIEDENKKVIAEGITDDKGVCYLPKPAAGKYQVFANAGAGHATQSPLQVVDPYAKVETKENFVPMAPGKAQLEQNTDWTTIAIGIGGVALFALILKFMTNRR